MEGGQEGRARGDTERSRRRNVDRTFRYHQSNPEYCWSAGAVSVYSRKLSFASRYRGLWKTTNRKELHFSRYPFQGVRDVPFGICMTGTSYNGFWQQYIPAKFVFQGLQPQMMQTLIDRQKKLVVKWRKDHPDAEPDDYKRTLHYAPSSSSVSNPLILTELSSLSALLPNSEQRISATLGGGPLL